MEKNDYTPVGEVKQLDTMELDIKVLENGVPKDLESSEISLYVRKKDGTILEQKENISIVEASEGTIKIRVKNQATACAGMTLFELELKGNDGIATTGTFIFIVNERVVNGEVVESKDEIHALVEVEKYVKLAKEELQRFKELQAEMLNTNEAIALNEEGRVSAEEKRVNAEEKRVNAEKKRALAEEERKEKFAGFENKINVNTEELEGARTAITGEQFDTLDERIDCEVDRLNKKIEVSFLHQEDKENHVIENTVKGITTDMVVKGRTLINICPRSMYKFVTSNVEANKYTKDEGENINLKTFGEKTYVSFENALSGTSSFKAPVDTVLALSNLTNDIKNKTDKKEANEINERVTESLELSEYNHSDINDNIFPYLMDLELMVLDMMELNGYTNKKYKISERAGINMTSKQALERLIRQKKVTLEDALDRIVRYNDAGRITDAEALELTDLAHEIL